MNAQNKAPKPARVNKAQPLDRTRAIWLQQHRETKKAYEEFIAYRDSEHRSTREHSNGFYNSVRWSWGERVKAWDAHLVQQEAEKLIRYRIDMNERHRAIAKLAQSRAAQWLRNLDERTIAKMKAGEVVRLLEVATRLERVAAGDGTPEVAVNVTAGVVEMTSSAADARIDQLIQEVEKRRQEMAREALGKPNQPDEGEDFDQDGEDDEE